MRAIWPLGLLLIGVCLCAAQVQDEELDAWDAASPSGQGAAEVEDDSSCAQIRQQLHAREAQVNELLGTQDQLQAAQKRLKGAEQQLKELRETQKSTGSAESRATKAETELAALRARLQEADDKLQTQQSECGSSVKAVQEAQKKVDALIADLAAAKKLVDSSEVSTKADKKALAEAQAALSRAQADAKSATSALSKAQEDVLGSMQALDDWTFAMLPAWTAAQYGRATAAAAPTLSSLSEAAQPYWESAHKVVSPHATVAYQRGSQYASQAYEVGGKYANTAYLQGSQLFTSGKKRGLEAWVAAHPHIQKALARSQVFARQSWGKTTAALGPGLKSASASLERGMRSVRRQAHELTAHPQLVQLKRQMASAWEELEALMARGLGQVKQLKPYARKPYTTYVLYAVMSFPFLLLAGPLLLAIGASDKSPRAAHPEQSAESDTPVGVKTTVSPSTAAAPSSRRKSKGKRIQDGDDVVEFR